MARRFVVVVLLALNVVYVTTTFGKIINNHVIVFHTTHSTILLPMLRLKRSLFYE